ncbi:PTS sugar transporter subunit IIA [Shouchella sp. 1P09AA]|uniref:PTS sugar transporter subunit IIA n=1 Tax=unclassified Shouchella TaxID=2893065 RepID=UPI0039A11FA5
MTSSLFDERFVFLNQTYKDKEEIILKLGSCMETFQCAEAGYTDELLTREQIAPTALRIHSIGVALPHIHDAYVTTSKIGVLTLTNPVPFKQMGATNKGIPVSIVCLLGIKNERLAKEAVYQLLIKLQDHAFLLAICSLSSSKEAIQLLSKCLVEHEEELQ